MSLQFVARLAELTARVQELERLVAELTKRLPVQKEKNGRS